MYIYQNGKLYVQVGNGLVGVEIYPDKVIKVKGTETKLGDSYKILTPHEVQSKFNIKEAPYIFPVEVKKEVEKVEPIIDTKAPVRKATRK